MKDRKGRGEGVGTGAGRQEAAHRRSHMVALTLEGYSILGNPIPYP